MRLVSPVLGGGDKAASLGLPLTTWWVRVKPGIHETLSQKAKEKWGENK